MPLAIALTRATCKDELAKLAVETSLKAIVVLMLTTSSSGFKLDRIGVISAKSRQTRSGKGLSLHGCGRSLANVSRCLGARCVQLFSLGVSLQWNQCENDRRVARQGPCCCRRPSALARCSCSSLADSSKPAPGAPNPACAAINKQARRYVRISAARFSVLTARVIRNCLARSRLSDTKRM